MQIFTNKLIVLVKLDVHLALTKARASKRTACEALFLLTFLTTSVPINTRCKTCNTTEGKKIKKVFINNGQLLSSITYFK